MAKTDKKADQSTKLFALDIFSKSKLTLLNLLRNHLEEQQSLLTLMTPNPEQIVLSRKDPTFLHHLQSADILIPDGIGLVIASKFVDLSKERAPITERISGKEVASFLLETASEMGLPVLVVGGRDYQTAKNGELSQLDLPQPYKQVFWLEGYKDVQSPTKEEDAAVTAAIKKVKPAIVLVAFGAPWQEQWLMEHQPLLSQSGVRIALVVGGALDMMLGKVPQAPAWIENAGLEWLFRLVKEPWRWRRQLKLLEFIKLTYQSM
ncbi:MAG: N-acetylglucosaminyldiphosphoundecaprenol N-acetyl-beta-D-mannosaminyltransferase [Patescibacteria group bacterium]|nr:N-acetylglucosaminyldiphosphoundecaprenol N-acetyl-beta-D-mannosaminyltransferase [Patescibacteria group bacterium]